MTSSRRRALHYGDIITLSTTSGAIGAFYPFKCLNDLLLLEHGSSLESAQALWCTFRVLPPYSYKDQAALRRENKQPQKDWVKISGLEKEVHLEKLDNKKRFIRSLMHTVRYLQQVQLQHVATGRYLGHTPVRTSFTEGRNFPCCLEDIPSEKTRFKMFPVMPGYASGDIVHSNDIINLFADPDGFVRDSYLPIPSEDSFYPSLSEINIGPVNEGFRLSVHYHIIENDEVKISSWDDLDVEELLDPKPLIGTNLLQFTKPGTEIRLVFDKDGKDTNLAFKSVPKVKDKHYCTSVETYWIVEHDAPEGAFSGDYITESSPVQLRHFVTGEYAKLPGNGKFIRIEPALLQENREKTFRTGAHVKLATDKGYIGSEDETVVSKPKFYFTDTVTVREVETEGRLTATKALGLRLLLDRIVANESNKNSCKLAVTNHLTVTSVMEDFVKLIDVHKESADDLVDFGIVDTLLKLAKLYSSARDDSREMILCLDATCKLLSKVSQVKTLDGFEKDFSELLSALISGDLKIAARGKQDDSEECLPRDSAAPEVVVPLKSLLLDNPYLLSSIPKQSITKLLEAFEDTDDKVKKREIAKVLCCLCRIGRKTVPSNQIIVSQFLFKGKTRSPALLKHVVKNNDVFFDGTLISNISAGSDLYLDLVCQLELYECILFGRLVNGEIKDKLVQNNMFTLKECVYVIKHKVIDSFIKSWYIQILIAGYIDTGFTDTKLVPQMLTFQYDENVTNRANGSGGNEENQKPPNETEDLYQKLLLELENFLRRNATCTVNDPESRRNNRYGYHMMRLLEYMFRAGRINFKNDNRFVIPLIAFLDGTNDLYSGTNPNSNNEQTFQKIFRFKPLEVNQPIFDIKNRALRVMYYAYEQAVYDYWTQVMKEIYSAVKNYSANKDTWLGQISDFLGQFDMKLSFHEVIIQSFEDPNFDILSPKQGQFRDSVKRVLVEEYERIELFAHMDEVIRILTDTMRYNDPVLSEKALKLLVMIQSPTNRLLDLLPKSSITLSNAEFFKRQDIVEEVTHFFTTAGNEVSLDSRESICKSLEALEESLKDENSGAINRTRQKLLFDVGTVSEVISLLCEPMSSLITTRLTDAELNQVAESVNKMKARAFSLLKHLINNLRPAQNTVINYFKELVRVKAYHQGEGGLPSRDLEVERVLALNGVFTANTNLCIKLNDDMLQVIFDKLLSLVNVKSVEELTLNSDATYRYMEMLENILDLEESDQVLYKLQASVLRFIRDYWEGLNGSMISEKGTAVSLNLLKSRQMHDVDQKVTLEARNWKGLYFVKTLSLMACCALGSLKSSLTICKELIPYGDLKTLMDTCATDVVYFTSLSKFFLDVYVKSEGHLKKSTLVSDALKYIGVGEGFVKTLFHTLLKGETAVKLDNLSSISYLEIRLKLSSDVYGQQSPIQLLDCVFNAILPLTTEVFYHTPSSLLDACNGGKVARNLSTTLRNLLRATSSFLNEENFAMLLAAIRAVNRYKPESTVSGTGSDLEVMFENDLWRISPGGMSRQVDGRQVTISEEILIKDVMDLKRQRSVNAKILEKQECNRVNEMFQKVVKMFRKTIKSEIPNKFFTKSDELETLGRTMLGTRELNETETEAKTLPEVVYTAPMGVITDAKDLVLDTLEQTWNRPLVLTYKDNELWELLKGVFSWLKRENSINEFIVKQLLNSITLQLEDLKPQQQEINETGYAIVSKLIDIGFVEMLASLITKAHSAEPAVSCLCTILRYPEAQKQMLHICRSSEDPNFEWVWDQIDTAIAGNTQFNMASSIILTASRPIIDIDTATPHMRLAIQFIGRLSNKTSKLQDYLRSQDNKIISHNFLTALLTLLKTIPDHGLISASSNCDKRMHQHNYMIVDILAALVDMLSVNTKAKEYAIEMGIIESIDRLLVDTKSNYDIKTSLKNRNTVCLDELVKIRISCYDLLITLLEYDQKLLDVGEKIADALSVEDLQQSVSDHLEILNQNSSSDVRELCSLAAFKGYNVLKKMEMLESFSSKQESSLQIDKTIEQNVQVESVEVVWNDSLEKVYFPRSPDKLIRRKVKDQILWGLARKTLTDKNTDFLYWSEEIIKDMKNVVQLQKIPIINKLVKMEFLWDWCVLLLAIVIQLWLLVDLEDYGMTESETALQCGEGDLAHLIDIGKSPGGNSSQQVCVSLLYFSAHNILGILHLISTILLTATYAITNYHRFKTPTFNWRAFIFGKSSEQASAHKPTVKRMSINYTSFYHLWLVIMITCSFLGIFYYGAMYCVHLLHIIAMFDLLTRVIRGATANRDQLLVIIPFAIFIIYIYSMIYFMVARSMFNEDRGEYCNTLFQCFTTALRYTLRNSNGGHNYSWTSKQTFHDIWIRIAIDSTFWLFYSIIGLKVVTALVLDGFISQKKLRENSLEDMASTCTICGLTKDEFAGKGIDWYTHTKYEHNMWSYINLFFYLKTTKNNSTLSAIEEDVLQKFKRKDISFLPRKISLSWKRALKEREKRRHRTFFVGSL